VARLGKFNSDRIFCHLSDHGIIRAFTKMDTEHSKAPDGFGIVFKSAFDRVSDLDKWDRGITYLSGILYQSPHFTA
jgi:hypothetical protein